MYDSPLRIFTAEQLQIISYSNLKEIKKEILLEFQFSPKSTAKINGHLIDKNSVLLIFQELEDRLHPYLTIENNPKLKSFFQTGNLEFLLEEEAKNDLSEIIRVYDSIGLKVADILSKIIRNECKSHTLESIKEISAWGSFLRVFYLKKRKNLEMHSNHCNNINLISIFSENLSSTNHLKAFDLAFSYLENRIEESKAIIKSMIGEDNSINFEIEGLEAYFNLGFINLFDVLPDHFEGLANKYTHYCMTTFVKPWINDPDDNFSLYSSGICLAAAVAVEKRNPSDKIDDFIYKLKSRYQTQERFIAYFIFYLIMAFSITASIIIIY